MKKNRNLKGMTLVECIIAMCVLGAIAGMFVTVAVKAKNMNTQNYKRSNTMYKQAAAAENFNTNVKYGMDCRVSKMITGGATNKVTMDANFGSIDLETEAYGYTAKRTDDDEDSQDKNYQLRFFRSDYADILDPPDPANGRYWIKIYNDTGSDIDWKFFATPTVDGGTFYDNDGPIAGEISQTMPSGSITQFGLQLSLTPSSTIFTMSDNEFINSPDHVSSGDVVFDESLFENYLEVKNGKLTGFVIIHLTNEGILNQEEYEASAGA